MISNFDSGMPKWLKSYTQICGQMTSHWYMGIDSNPSVFFWSVPFIHLTLLSRKPICAKVNDHHLLWMNITENKTATVHYHWSPHTKKKHLSHPPCSSSKGKRRIWMLFLRGFIGKNTPPHVWDIRHLKSLTSHLPWFLDLSNFPPTPTSNPVQRKNCDPFVLGPALAMDKMPGPVWSSWKPSFRSRWKFLLLEKYMEGSARLSPRRSFGGFFLGGWCFLLRWKKIGLLAKQVIWCWIVNQTSLLIYCMSPIDSHLSR